MKNSAIWEGNIEFTLKTKLYVDFSGDINDREYFTNQMQRLKKELDKAILPIQEPTTVKGFFECLYLNFLTFNT